MFQDELERPLKTSDSRKAPYLCRLTKEVPVGFSILEVIAACGATEKFFFRTKDGELVLGGLGSALTLTTGDPEEILRGFGRIWEEDENIAVFGGFAFDTALVPASEWERFSAYRFVLPFIEMRQFSQSVRLTVYYVNDRRLTLWQVRRAISESMQRLDQRTVPLGLMSKSADHAVRLVPSREQWDTMICNALRMISKAMLNKIVLARKKIISSAVPWNPGALLRALAGIREESFTFFYQVDEGVAFLGRSPERLFRLEDGRIYAEAIAGTRSRGRNDFDDRRLEAELLGSAKEIQEHRFVSGFIESRMRRYCSHVRKECVEDVLKLKNVQHILTRFAGFGCWHESPLAVAAAFHPTPAVGGVPQERILELLRKSEPFSRGWYAAPIGWMTRIAADFAVGIRSALVHGKHLHIYAGAGIVTQSNPRAEWDETEKKMDHFTAVLKEN